MKEGSLISNLRGTLEPSFPEYQPRANGCDSGRVATVDSLKRFPVKSSFAPQRDHRIDPRRSTRGNKTSGQRNRDKQQWNSCEDDRIGRADFE